MRHQGALLPIGCSGRSITTWETFPRTQEGLVNGSELHPAACSSVELGRQAHRHVLGYVLWEDRAVGSSDCGMIQEASETGHVGTSTGQVHKRTEDIPSRRNGTFEKDILDTA